MIHTLLLTNANISCSNRVLFTSKIPFEEIHVYKQVYPLQDPTMNAVGRIPVPKTAATIFVLPITRFYKAPICDCRQWHAAHTPFRR